MNTLPTDNDPVQAWMALGVQSAILARTMPAVRHDLAGPLSASVCTVQHLGMAAGEFFPTGLNAEMAGDQRGDDALSVVFDGVVLAEPL